MAKTDYPRMIKGILSFVFTSFFALSSYAQPASQYIIQLKDKTGTPFQVSDPEAFLSRRAIDRRNRQNIPVVENDLPVNPAYINAIRSIPNVTVLNTSKWLNQVYIQTNDPDALAQVSALSFVKNSFAARRMVDNTARRKKFDEGLTEGDNKRPMGANTEIFHGLAEDQIKIHHGNYLHNKGLMGQGMIIAIIDDGFNNYLTLPAFDSIRLNNRILDTFDFVGNKNGLNAEDAHGMSCLSTMAANVPGQMIGSAPGASYLLYRSENISFEYPGEEQNWIAAAERSDSAGADVITTSLGYSTFDNPSFDYDYQDMNGRTTMMSVGAAIAAAKGMILIIAAGNEGNKPWHYITTPGDAVNVLTVGAVDISGNPAPFSSWGPTSDGRIKPDVSSVGWGTYLQKANGTFAKGNGTSYATPNLAGLVTCLWQAFPDFSAADVMDVIKKSSDRFSNPDNKTGYGIPNFEIAYQTLTGLREQRRQQQLAEILKDDKLTVFPNPMKDGATVIVRTTTTGTATLNWYDSNGRRCFSQSAILSDAGLNTITLKRNALPSGVYFFRFQIGTEKAVKKVILY